MITVQLDESKMFGGQPPQGEPPDHGLISRLTAAAKPPVVVAGVPMPVREGRVVKVLGDDSELLSKTTHVRHAGERLIQFHARTGLGAAQIRSMSRDQIAEFVNTVERNDKGWTSEPRAQKFSFPAASGL